MINVIQIGDINTQIMEMNIIPFILQSVRINATFEIQI
jgi:hypothetical protein